MKILITAAMALALAPSLQAQDSFDKALSNPREQTNPSAGLPPKASAPSTGFQDTDQAGKPLPQKEWTIMVFMNGKNNLQTDGINDLNEMEQVGSGKDVNVLVEMGGMDNKMYRYYIRKDADPAKVTSPAMAKATGVNMGDPASIVDFVLWAQKQFPAKKYMLIGWDHGSGWLKGNPVKPAGKGFSDDWISKNNISTPQLGWLLKEIEAKGGRVDLLAFDACLMQMAEVLYEIKGTKVAYMAASEEIEPGAGYAYHQWLAPLAANPKMDAVTLGKTVARKYLDTYPDGDRGTGLTYSVTDVSKAGALASAMNAFAEAAIASGEKAALVKARDEATYYQFDDNKDLRHFAMLTAGYAKNGALKSAAQALADLLAQGKGPVVVSGVSKNNPTKSYGLAVYLPSYAFSRDYLELKLASSTRWAQMLAFMLKP